MIPVMPRPAPLAGRIVVVTRPRERAGGIHRLLAARGARVVSAPMIAFASGDRKGLARAAREARAGRYGWAFFTSATGVAASGRTLVRALAESGVRIGAVGPATAGALRAAGGRAHLVPRGRTGAALASAWGRRTGASARGIRVLLLQPDIAPADLERALRRRGAVIDRVTAYRTRGVGALPGLLVRLARAGRIDWIALASPSAARRLAELLARSGFPARRFAAAAIGPTTARAARRLGFRVLAESPDRTERGLVRAMERAETKKAAPFRARP